MEDRDPMEIIASLTADTDSSEESVSEETTADIVAEEQGVEPIVDPEATVEPVEEKLYAGKYKTPEELENAYKHAEQRMHQEAQQRAQYEQYLAQLQAQQAQPVEQPDPYSPEPRNLQELIEYTYEDPEEAFWFAATKAPASLPRVVNEIRQFDPAAADKFIIEHQQWQTQTVAEQQQQMARQQQEQIQAAQMQAQLPYMQQQAAQAVAEAHGKIASLPDYDVIKDDIANIIKERPYLINVESESTLARGLRDAYDLAVSRNAQKIQAANAARAGAVGEAGVESGSFSGQNTAVDENPVDDFRASIFKAANGVRF